MSKFTTSVPVSNLPVDGRSKRGKDLAARLNEQTIYAGMPKLYFVEDFGKGRYRVGRTDWPGDYFNLVPIHEFETFRKVYEGLSMPLFDYTDSNGTEDEELIQQEWLMRVCK